MARKSQFYNFCGEKNRIKKNLFITNIFFVIAFIADVGGILGFYKAESKNPFFWIMGILGFLFLIYKSIFKDLADKIKVLEDGKSYFIGGETVLNVNGEIHSYQLTGKCIQPHCDGIIEVQFPPERHVELGKIGVCTIDKKNHTYKIDFNHVATPVYINWTPFEKTSNKNKS